MPFRHEKLEARIQELAAQFIEKEAGTTSLITVTNCTVSSDTKKALILITTIPASKEAAAFGFVKRNLGEMRLYIRKHLNANVPYLDVTIDKGERNRQLVDEILRQDARERGEESETAEE